MQATSLSKKPQKNPNHHQQKTTSLTAQPLILKPQKLYKTG